MTRVLLFIKHRLPCLWSWLERLNTLLFRMLHGKKLRQQAELSIKEFSLEGYDFRVIKRNDLESVRSLSFRQTRERLIFFHPHRFELKDLEKVNRNPAFMMFGVFHQEQLVGYFFLRCFWNRKCFVGRLIDEPHEKKGIGRVMNQIMYQTAWRSDFRVYTTVSLDNQMVIRSHINNPMAYFVEELPNNYLLLEFRDRRVSNCRESRESLKEYFSRIQV